MRFKSAQYNETALRVEFISPPFEAPGWNVRDSARIKATDRAIDDHVYKLYDLAQQDIAIVAGRDI